MIEDDAAAAEKKKKKEYLSQHTLQLQRNPLSRWMKGAFKHHTIPAQRLRAHLY